MASTAVAGGQVLDASNPAVARVRQLIGGPEYCQGTSPLAICASMQTISDSCALVSCADGWSRCWEEGVTPWDLGQPTPAVVELAKSGTLPGDAATVLVPGCGTVSPSPSSACIIGRTSHAPPLAPRRYASCLALMWTQFVQGYDVVALSGPGRFVVGLDICESAVAKAKQWSAAADGSLFAFVVADFFTWEPPELFDLIFDYTCMIIS